MAKHSIEITLDANGDNIVIEAFGYSGKACEQATAAFEEAFSGNSKGKQKKKPEYTQTLREGNKINAR